ncbi:hypothetical protein AgCh_000889 [Apium graveolens]
MEQRSKRKGSKARPVALKVEEKPKEKARRKIYSKGKAMIAKSDTELSNSDDDSNPDTESDTDCDHNNNENMDQMASLLVKSFKKMVYKNFKKGIRFSRKGSSSSNSDKRNNITDTDWKEARSGKYDKSKERCYNCDGLGHFADSDDGISYALMESANVEVDNTELKVPHSTLAFDTDDICELRLFLKTLYVSYRDQTLMNNRIKSENFMLKKRNDYLEIDLLSMLKFQKERDNVVYVKEKLFEKHAYLENELAKEREVIKLWTNSGKTTQEILEKDCWGSGLGYSARTNSDKKSGEETEKTEPIKTDSQVKSNKKQLKQKPKDLHMKGKKRSRKNRNGKKAKQRKTSFKSKTESSILKPYHLLHVDLFGLVNVMSIAKKRYALVIVDEFTRYTWVYFLHTKDVSLSILLDHVRDLEKRSTYKVKIIRSDNETEFKNSSMEEFCKLKGIRQEFSAPGTPQQNGVVERKNRTLIEAAEPC